MSPEKILYIAGDTSLLGGIEKYNKEFIASLESLGSQVVPVYRKKGGLPQKLWFFLSLILTAFRTQPTFIICGHLNFSPLAFALSVVLRTHFSLNIYGIETKHITGLRKYCASKALVIVTIAHYIEAKILRSLPSFSSKIFMLPSSVDELSYNIYDSRASVYSKYNISSSKVILTISRLAPLEYKNQHMVIKSLPLLSSSDFTYIVAGGGFDSRITDELSKCPELSRKVIFTGPISESEKIDLLNAADVFVLPSKYEGFGIVFIEALACGLPVIASDGYGCREALQNGRLGYLVNPDDPQSISSAINTVLSDPQSSTYERRQSLRVLSTDIYGRQPWRARISDFYNNFISNR